MRLPRSRLATAVVSAAVLASVVTSACGSASPPATDPLAGVAWDRHVRDCSVDEGGSGLGTVIDEVVKGEVTGDERVDTLVVDRCESSTSPWPQVVEVFDGASDPAAPRRLGLLLDGDPEYPRDVNVTVEPGGRIAIVGRGLSATAPLCCPDLTLRRMYRYDGGQFSLVESMSSPAVHAS
jgi:hypothetical protein